MRFIDLFCGIGGFRVALEKGDNECVFACDIDSKVQSAYRDNFGDKPEGDVTEITADSIPPHDMLCAGFPCQSFSISGNHGGVGDARGRLFYDIIRIAQKHKPIIMLLENVKNILTIDNASVINMIKSEIDEIGYDIYYNTCNASLYGIPQKRERVYFVCLRKGEGLRYNPPKETGEKKYLDDIIMSNDDCKDLIVERDDMYFTRDKQEHQLKPIRIGHVNKAHQGERIYSTKGHSVTIAATTGGAGANTGLYLVGDKVRRLHTEECKELMGFPKLHKLSNGREAYKQLGNAVMPPMISRVYDGIV